MLNEILRSKEDEHLECKAARNRFDFELLVKYCSALANERGGRLVLGVTDNLPRKVVGSSAFPDLERTKAGLIERLHLRIEVEEIHHEAGRIVLFRVPSRPLGFPVGYKGAYWMRGGEDLVPMTPDLLKRIFEECAPDYSAEICPGASLEDLALDAVDRFRGKWAEKSKNHSLLSLPPEQLLNDAELLVNGGITYAALVLFGTREALGKFLAQSEIIFEYRATETSLVAQQRKEYREGFFLVENALWETINLRNEIQQYREGLFMKDIRTFNEDVVREVILNAVCHRDYRLGSSTFVRQYPRKLEIVSPGGFPPGITPDNILWKQAPRNRRLAEAFSKCGLVERSGQGINRMFEECVKESKPNPDFAGTDDFQVSVTLQCQVQDVHFLRFIEQVGKERLASFSTEDFLVLELVRKERKIPDCFRNRLPGLADLGVVEKAGRGRYILSRKFYGFLGQKGVYTRKKGLDRETNMELLCKHIYDNRNDGCKLQELLQVLPSCTHGQVQKMLQRLKLEGRIHPVGSTNAARWYSGPAPE